MKKSLKRLINNEYLNSSELFKLNQLGLILKITYRQYVITKKGFQILTEKSL